MLRRLKYYGIGFGIGLIFVIFFFENRGCSWLPGNRVKNAILDRVLVLSENETIDKKDIVSLLNDGKVNFKKSKREGNPKVYLIEKEKISAYFTLPEESFISEVKLAVDDVSKISNSDSGFGKFIFFPNDNDLVFVDTLGILACQLSALEIQERRTILKKLKNHGRIDFSKTDFSARPKVEHLLLFKDKQGREIAAKANWYKNKINIHYFELPFENDCE